MGCRGSQYEVCQMNLLRLQVLCVFVQHDKINHLRPNLKRQHEESENNQQISSWSQYPLVIYCNLFELRSLFSYWAFEAHTTATLLMAPLWKGGFQLSRSVERIEYTAVRVQGDQLPHLLEPLEAQRMLCEAMLWSVSPRCIKAPVEFAQAKKEVVPAQRGLVFPWKTKT